VTGVPLTDEGDPISWGQQCSDMLSAHQLDAVGRFVPDLVVWLSSWELAARDVGGTSYRFGTAEGDLLLLDLMRQASARLGSAGADIAVLTLPPSVDADIREADPVFDARAAHYNGLLAHLEAGAADRLHVVDFAALVCAGAPEACPAEVDGLRARPRDGAHFEPEGAHWAGALLADQLLALRV
jgi:hypothetical protein